MSIQERKDNICAVTKSAISPCPMFGHKMYLCDVTSVSTSYNIKSIFLVERTRERIYVTRGKELKEYNPPTEQASFRKLFFSMAREFISYDWDERAVKDFKFETTR